jgi:hypothetical protein
MIYPIVTVVCKDNIRDQVIALLGLLETAKGHLGAGNVLLGILKVGELDAESVSRSRTHHISNATTYQSLLVPGDALLLVGIGVGETLDLAGLAAEDAVQVRADLVGTVLLEGMALGATGLEEVGALGSVTYSQIIQLEMRITRTESHANLPGLNPSPAIV